MARLILISLLVLSVLCMVPLMGIDHATAGHLHHGASASCATCLGLETFSASLFLLALVGLSLLMIPVPPPRVQVRGLFHPPRVR